MRFSFIVSLAGAALMSTAAAAETKTPTEPAQRVEDKGASNDKKICKRLETSATRMVERICLTKEQWKKVEEEVAQ